MSQRIKRICVIVLVFVCSECVVEAHSDSVHQELASGAMELANEAWGSDWLPEEWKTEINDGSWQEDYRPPEHSPETDPLGYFCRTKNHAYNPITNSTGGIFWDAYFLCPEGGWLTAREYAEDLWADMLSAGSPVGGDGIGAYHYLGRCCHLLQDMSSFPHIHPNDIWELEHSSFEGEEAGEFANGISRGDTPLMPTDPLEWVTTDNLDGFSSCRLSSKPFASNDVGSFIEIVARITYFRSTFWGEVIFRNDTTLPSEGGATDEYTAETTFGDSATAGAEINTLRTMFGEPNIRYVNDLDDDYFVIEDRQGHTLTWESSFDEEWHPCTGDTIDGCITVGGEDPVDQDVRTTGRFMFKEPYYPVVPQNYPNGERFNSGNLGYYMSLYSMRAGSAYNAGLLRVGAGPRFGDFNRDGWTDCADAQILAQAWLADDPLIDVAPGAEGDGVVDFADYAVLGEHWTPKENVPVPPDIVWVYINDPGVSSHEGFTGYMSKYETTNAQYAAYLNAAKSDGLITIYNNDVYAVSDASHSQIYFELYPGSSSYSQITYSGGVFSVRSRDGYSMANHPVVEVSWYGATAFCNYYGYRLPTEWEWQAVADYDGSYTYGCGTTINHSKANYDWGNPLNLSSYPYTSPVDYYSSYGYGMNDMAGNVWEWTDSCYYSHCEYGDRVLRGGGWGTYGLSCAVSLRSSGIPDYSSTSLGFRACR